MKSNKTAVHSNKQIPSYYRWLIVAAGMISMLASLGIGRFSLGPLLPAMREPLSLNYTQMGFISTANLIGYLLAVISSSSLVDRIGARMSIFAALLVIGISMVLISRADNYPTVLALFTITGLASGYATIPTMMLVGWWFPRNLRGRATGFVMVGNGFGLILTGKLIPMLTTHYPTSGWRYSWMILGSIVLGISVICFLVIRKSPAEMEDTTKNETELENKNIDNDNLSRIGRKIAHLGAIYFCFGYTYIIYATFLVTFLINDRGFSDSSAGDLWAWVGSLSLISGPLFGFLSDRFGRKAALFVVFSLQAVSYIFATMQGAEQYIILSIICFGVTVWAIPTIMAALVNDSFGIAKATSVFGIVTFVFSMGQITGPAVAGIMAEISGSFLSSFGMAAAVACLGALLSCTIKRANNDAR